MYENIKKWYGMKLWTEKMVHDAVDKGFLTELEYQEIIKGE